MQLMCDAISVLGSRHGLLFNPVAGRCEIVRFDTFEKMTHLALRAGIVIGERKLTLPLCGEGPHFQFHDQRLTPCTMSIMGIDPASGVKLKLTVVTPFRPRDPSFSTTPVLAIRLEASKIAGGFRWTRREVEVDKAEIFLEFKGDALTVEESGEDSLDLRFVSVRSATEGEGSDRRTVTEEVPQHDRLIALTGKRRGRHFAKRVSFEPGSINSLDVAWCTHSGPVLAVQGQRYPFKYASAFHSLGEVAAWARANPEALFENARNVDGIVARHNRSQSVNHLLAYTLHSWLIDTWWADRGGKDWFSVWEGNCYFHSTVDVEYTQAPFYLAVWPDLLGMELDQWPAYSKDGARCLGARGEGTLFLSHDAGNHASASGQVYPHEMEVEETTNYIILAYCHYRRTGNASVIHAHAETIEKYVAFIIAADTSGSGVPDKGVANTVDDASPAIQYGKAQVYLAVKTLAAMETGAEILKLLGKNAKALECRTRAQKIRTLIEEKGWMGDHFATLLDRQGHGLVDPWTGKEFSLDEIPGWDAPHIYTVNGMAVLDMVGMDLGIDRKKIVRDLQVATERCLREYGCVHTDFHNTQLQSAASMQGLAGSALNPGWISMNMLRDIAAFYRGVDLQHLADRYWNWQVTANTQEPKLFFETFSGNNLCFYPRGVAIWGYFDALAGLVIDAVTGIDKVSKPISQVSVPKLYDADWQNGTCQVISKA